MCGYALISAHTLRCKPHDQIQLAPDVDLKCHCRALLFHMSKNMVNILEMLNQVAMVFDAPCRIKLMMAHSDATAAGNRSQKAPRMCMEDSRSSAKIFEIVPTKITRLLAFLMVSL